MIFTNPLQHGILIQRYKRFLADIQLSNGEIVTIHCANTGAMTGCANSGDTVWYSTSDNPKRKLPYSWELTQTNDNHWICVNTIKANTIVKDAIIAEQIPELQGYYTILSEVKYGDENSRIDLLLNNQLKNQLKDARKTSCYIEVKSVTFYDENNQTGYFPDAKTTRGQKHLRELMLMKQRGNRAVIFFLVMHSGIRYFSPATHIDPIYSQLLKQAIQSGVEVLCYNTNISIDGITIKNKIPIVIG